MLTIDLYGVNVALLYQHFGSWSSAFYGSALFALTSGLIAFGLRIAPLPRKPAVLASVPAASG